MAWVLYVSSIRGWEWMRIKHIDLRGISWPHIHMATYQSMGWSITTVSVIIIFVLLMLLSMWMWDFPPYDMVFTCYLHSEVLKKHKKRDRISGKDAPMELPSLDVYALAFARFRIWIWGTTLILSHAKPWFCNDFVMCP